MSGALSDWGEIFARYLQQQGHNDAAHDLEHVRRVVSNALKLAASEGACQEIVYPAAWLHDCVAVPKDSPQRSQASRMAARRAAELLREIGYPLTYLAEIEHAIEAHSFSAGIQPRTLEAKVVQDADRLDALGAIGIARCIMTGVGMSRPLYHATDPFCLTRQPDDRTATLDHFFTKLLGLVATMQTNAGRAEARKRTDFIIAYLEQLESEIISGPNRDFGW